MSACGDRARSACSGVETMPNVRLAKTRQVFATPRKCLPLALALDRLEAEPVAIANEPAHRCPSLVGQGDEPALVGRASEE
jgi:hypothetical protein